MAVPGHDVLEAVAVYPPDHGAHEVVAEAVEGTGVLLRIGSVGQAVAHNHIGLAREDGSTEVAGRFRRVGVVAVDHEVAVGIDVAEHLATDVALALARLAPDGGAVRAGDLGGAVGRVVVVDVDFRLGQFAAEVVHDLGYRRRLVVARDDHGDPVSAHCRLPYSMSR